MGESKRRKGAADAAAREVIAASYAPASVALVLPGGSADPDYAEGIANFVAFLRMPNAMRPVGWPSADLDDEGPVSDALLARLSAAHAAIVDAEGNVVRTLTEAEADGFLDIADGIPGACEGTGDAVEIGASVEHGFLDVAGRPASDPRELLGGLVRVDHNGTPIVAADAPLSLQAATLGNTIGYFAEAGDEAGVLAAYAHLVHVSVLFLVLRSDPLPDPGTWLDLAKCSDVMAHYQGVPLAGLPFMDVTDLIDDLADEMDGARRTDPMWTLGPVLGTEHTDWISRDSRGTGLLWADLGTRFAKAKWSAPVDPPNADAQQAEIGGDSLVRTRALLSRCPLVAVDGADRVYRDDARGLHLALLSDLGDKSLVAWPFVPSAESRSDPLMAETLSDLMRDDPPVETFKARIADPRARDGLEALASLSVLDALPDPFPEYAALMFVSAHRRGLGISDLCACLAETVASGSADESFLVEPPPAATDEEPLDDLVFDDRLKERALASAKAFGGRRDEALEAMLAGVDDWDGVDLGSDLRLLRDAAASGCNLQDVAIVVFGFLEGPGEEDCE